MNQFRIYIGADDSFVALLDWNAADSVMTKVYKSESATDWSGVIWHGNRTGIPSDSPDCGWRNELCAEAFNYTIIIVLVCVGIVVLAVFVSMGYGVKRYKYEIDLKHVASVILKSTDITDLTGEADQYDSAQQSTHNTPVLLNDQDVTVEVLPVNDLNIQDRKVLVELKTLKDLSHDNLVKFKGLYTTGSNVCIVWDWNARGSLQDIIQQGEMKLEWAFKMSILKDIIMGMHYLHQSEVGLHGHLYSGNCMIDSRWICKVTHHGLENIRQTSRQHSRSNLLQHVWTAPEFLRDPNKKSTQKGDIYSFAIIAQEVILECIPYDDNLLDEYIVEKVRAGTSPPYRPHLAAEMCNQELKQLIEVSWSEEPKDRPTFQQVWSRLQKINRKDEVSLVDSMINRLAMYTTKLEDKVAERARSIEDEKKKVEQILGELLPPSVAAQLAVGRCVEPEVFDNVTIFFSDIVGFTRIAAQSSATEVVELLNCIYSMFDGISQRFDVFKVATIGDAYMVASGVPHRNDNRHGQEICRMAFSLLDSVKGFVIGHLQNTHLYLRVGIHSGACVAGVAGTKMPRYLLFGDTVDIAAKMESSGECMKIQVSETTTALLQDNPAFISEPLGTMEIKGIYINTFWLTETGGK